MRRAPTSGPALSFKPKDVLTFRHPQREHGIEVLKATIEIANRSSRTVNFCKNLQSRWQFRHQKLENEFSDDPEFNFSPRSSCIAPESTVVVFAKFYNVGGNCQPHRSSVVLRAIRVRNEDEEGVERLWKRTHPDHIGEKRWKLRFEKDQPISGVPILPNVKKWTTYRATASKSLLTRAVESTTRLMDLRLSWIVVILAVVCLFGLWLGKSGLVPYSSKLAHRQGLLCGAGARKMWQWSATWAGKNLSSPVVSSRWPWVIVAASGLAAVLTALHVLFMSKPRHLQNPDECFTIGTKEYCF